MPCLGRPLHSLNRLSWRRWNANRYGKVGAGRHEVEGEAMWRADEIHLDYNLVARAFRDQQLISEDITAESGARIDCRGLERIPSHAGIVL